MFSVYASIKAGQIPDLTSDEWKELCKTATMVTNPNKDFPIRWHKLPNSQKIHCYGLLKYKGNYYIVLTGKGVSRAIPKTTDLCHFLPIPKETQKTNEILTCCVSIIMRNVGEEIVTSEDRITANMKEVKGFPETNNEFRISTFTESYTLIETSKCWVASRIKTNLLKVLTRERKKPGAIMQKCSVTNVAGQLRIEPPLTKQQSEDAIAAITEMEVVMPKKAQ